MAWTEQISTRTWRVRYRTGDGHTASISGSTSTAADAAAAADASHLRKSEPHPPEVLRIADQASALGGQTAGLLIITALAAARGWLKAGLFRRRRALP